MSWFQPAPKMMNATNVRKNSVQLQQYSANTVNTIFVDVMCWLKSMDVKMQQENTQEGIIILINI
jgi:hypothetical protein